MNRFTHRLILAALFVGFGAGAFAADQVATACDASQQRSPVVDARQYSVSRQPATGPVQQTITQAHWEPTLQATRALGVHSLGEPR